MRTTSLPSRKSASSDAKLAADLRAQKSCRSLWQKVFSRVGCTGRAVPVCPLCLPQPRSLCQLRPRERVSTCRKARLTCIMGRTRQGRAAGFRASSSTGRQAEQRGWKCNKRNATRLSLGWLTSGDPAFLTPGNLTAPGFKNKGQDCSCWPA